MTIELELPLLPPSINDLWVPGFRRGKPCLFNSKQYDSWREDMAHFARVQRKGRVIVGPYNLTVQLKRPDDLRQRDLDNYSAKAISDLLADVGMIANDCWAEMINARWVTNGEAVYVRIDPAGVEC